MLNYDFLVAAVLLTSPVDSPELLAHLELIQPALLRLAIAAEILDAREETLLKGQSRDPVGDLHALRQRFDHLLNAPAVFEGDLFPERKLIEEFLAFNRSYRKELVARLECDPHRAEELRPAIAEVDQLHFVWNLLRDARCRYYYVTVRRESLRQVHDLIGAEAFYRSQMPPHVPLAQFPRLR
jgi:hypothetical protein